MQRKYCLAIGIKYRYLPSKSEFTSPKIDFIKAPFIP